MCVVVLMLDSSVQNINGVGNSELNTLTPVSKDSLSHLPPSPTLAPGRSGLQPSRATNLWPKLLPVLPGMLFSAVTPAIQATQGSDQALCPQLGTASESLPCLAICCSPSSLLSEADRGLAPLRALHLYLQLVFVSSPGAGAKASACVSLQQTQDSEVAEIKLRSQGILNPRTILASYSQDQNNPGFL